MAHVRSRLLVLAIAPRLSGLAGPQLEGERPPGPRAVRVGGVQWVCRCGLEVGGKGGKVTEI
jgi:hypothetical protein